LIGLRQAAVSITSVNVDKPTLDEVFLALTGHDTGQPEEPDRDEVVRDEAALEVSR
jgi:ABC-2 type transport system ATP-binding protein